MGCREGGSTEPTVGNQLTGSQSSDAKTNDPTSLRSRTDDPFYSPENRGTVGTRQCPAKERLGGGGDPQTSFSAGLGKSGEVLEGRGRDWVGARSLLHFPYPLHRPAAARAAGVSHAPFTQGPGRPRPPAWVVRGAPRGGGRGHWRPATQPGPGVGGASPSLAPAPTPQRPPSRGGFPISCHRSWSPRPAPACRANPSLSARVTHSLVRSRPGPAEGPYPPRRCLIE